MDTGAQCTPTWMEPCWEKGTLSALDTTGWLCHLSQHGGNRQHDATSWHEWGSTTWGAHMFEQIWTWPHQSHHQTEHLSIWCHSISRISTSHFLLETGLHDAQWSASTTVWGLETCYQTPIRQKTYELDGQGGTETSPSTDLWSCCGSWTSPRFISVLSGNQRTGTQTVLLSNSTAFFKRWSIGSFWCCWCSSWLVPGTLLSKWCAFRSITLCLAIHSWGIDHRPSNATTV